MTMNGRSPYPGLRAYHGDESDLFFGREDCIDDMVERLAATRFLAVLGASGSGKSSLVRTGLLDALELGLHSQVGSRWLIADAHPGGQPMRNLALGLLRASGNDTPEALDLSLLESFLRRGTLPSRHGAATAMSPRDRIYFSSSISLKNCCVTATMLAERKRRHSSLCCLRVPRRTRRSMS